MAIIQVSVQRKTSHSAPGRSFISRIGTIEEDQSGNWVIGDWHFESIRSVPVAPAKVTLAGWTVPELIRIAELADYGEVVVEVSSIEESLGIGVPARLLTGVGVTPLSVRIAPAPLMGYVDPEEQRQYQREWLARRRAEYFDGKVCARCGSTSDLRLDHKDSALKIDHRIWSWSQARREEELAKCQVLCHLCHVEKTVECQENARGVRIATSKLMEEEVRLIRQRVAEGQSKRGVARDFSVDEKLVRLICSNAIWKHVGSDPNGEEPVSKSGTG